MAIRYAVATGNWSNTATWNGGTLPSSTDDVFSNTFEVTIDQDITVNTIQATSGSGITQGGHFLVSTVGPGVTRTITITTTLSAAHQSSFNSSRLLYVRASSGTLIINASVSSVSSGSERCMLEVYNASGLAITFNGNYAGSSGSNCAAIYASSNFGSLTINGNLTGSYGTVVRFNSASCPIFFNGDIINNATGTIYLQQGNLSVRGTIGSGAITNQSGNVRVSGTLTTSSSGVPPISGPWNVITGESFQYIVRTDSAWPGSHNGVQMTLVPGTQNLPDAGDVRDGTTFGPLMAMSGTLAVPPAASVAAGVPTDDTVGTAALSLSDLAAVTGAQITAALHVDS